MVDNMSENENMGSKSVHLKEILINYKIHYIMQNCY